MTSKAKLPLCHWALVRLHFIYLVFTENVNMCTPHQASHRASKKNTEYKEAQRSACHPLFFRLSLVTLSFQILEPKTSTVLRWQIFTGDGLVAPGGRVQVQCVVLNVIMQKASAQLGTSFCRWQVHGDVCVGYTPCFSLTSVSCSTSSWSSFPLQAVLCKLTVQNWVS